MSSKKEIKLSSNWSNVGLYGGALLCIVFIPILYYTITNQEFHVGIVIGAFIFLLLSGFMIYQFIYVCNAKIIDETLVMKKQFRPSKSYTFDKIGKTSSFYIKTNKYITVEMKNVDNSSEKYLIINSKSLLAFENKDAEQALISLRNLAKGAN